MAGRRGEEGSIHPLMLAVVVCLALAAALIRDVGTLAVAKWQAMQDAEDTADAAAQAVDEPHYTATGQLRLDPHRALELAAASLDVGEKLTRAAVAGVTASVEISRPAPTSLISVPPVKQSATSTLDHGVSQAEP